MSTVAPEHTRSGNAGQVTPFAPEDLTPDHIAVAWVLQLFRRLSDEALKDVAELGVEAARCDDRETLVEIMETMREILIPGMIGNVNTGSAGPVKPTEALKKRMGWIGEKVKQRRKEKGLTQEGLAQKSGLPQSHISRIEGGRHSPSHKTLRRLAKALGVPTGELDPAWD